ncbi:MAG: efflux RND transporter periplasmic adaptor subunit [Azonexus sp.]
MSDSSSSPIPDSPTPAASPVSSSRRRPLIIALSLAVLGLAGGAGWYFWNSSTPAEAPSGPGGPGGRPNPIVVEAATTEDFPVRLSAIGTVVPRTVVTVRSRVDGTLNKVNFEEGQNVRAGELLAEIDPRPYEVALTQVQGQMGKDEALLANARADLARYEGLARLDAIPAQQLDTQRALVRQYEAAVRVDQGAVDNARLQLSYTRITAPADGRTGLRQVDPGNLVRSSDANGIVVITQVQPVTVVFPIPEADLGKLLTRLGMQSKREGGRAAPRSGAAGEHSGAASRIRGERRALAEGGENAARRSPGEADAGRPARETRAERAAGGERPAGERRAERGAADERSAAGKNDRRSKLQGSGLAVEAWDRDGKVLLATGEVLTVDNQLDVTTGTVKVKAIFANQDGALFPNQFVNVRLIVNELKAAVVIPSAAVQRGAKGSFVWLLKDDKTVGMRLVEVGAADGDRIPVLNGLQAGEQVAVDGFDRLREGARVEVVSRESRGVKEGAGGRSGGKRGGPRGENGGPGLPPGTPAAPGTPATPPVSGPAATAAPGAAGTRSQP